MKRNKLERHFDSKHAGHKGKDRSFFECKLSVLRATQLNRHGEFHQANERALEASYRVSLKIAKAKKPHTIAEELIVPCAMEMASFIFGNVETGKNLG